MEQAVLTSNLKKLPKKLIKEMMDDLLILFPKGKDGEAPSPTLVTAWLKVYSAIKETYPAGNVGFKIPTNDENIYIQTEYDINRWQEDSRAIIKVMSEKFDGAETLHTAVLSRSALLNLHTFTATAIAHLPNE
tara:strand:- start:710 stop:1108 length:399 start_codon:yes stop_codon:yes gene_type:complete